MNNDSFFLPVANHKLGWYENLRCKIIPKKVQGPPTPTLPYIPRQIRWGLHHNIQLNKHDAWWLGDTWRKKTKDCTRKCSGSVSNLQGTDWWECGFGATSEKNQSGQMVWHTWSSMNFAGKPLSLWIFPWGSCWAMLSFLRCGFTEKCCTHSFSMLFHSYRTS